MHMLRNDHHSQVHEHIHQFTQLPLEFINVKCQNVFSYPQCPSPTLPCSHFFPLNGIISMKNIQNLMSSEVTLGFTHS